MRCPPKAMIPVACALGFLPAFLCAGAGCASDTVGPAQPHTPDRQDAGLGQTGSNAGSGGFTEVWLPCEGSNYAQLDGEVATYTVWIHSENTDLTETLATQERQTADAMDAVLAAYGCDRLLGSDTASIEEELKRALEERYQDETGDPGVIDALELSIEACE